MIKLIYASTKDFGIGINNTLPWNQPDDLSNFKKLTDNSVVVMGSKTWDSLPFALPNRLNVVVGSNVNCDEKHPDVIIRGSLEQEIYNLVLNYPDKDIWIIGGKMLYESIINQVEEIHHTVIDGDYKCDTFFNHTAYKFKLIEGRFLNNECRYDIWKRIY